MQNYRIAAQLAFYIKKVAPKISGATADVLFFRKKDMTNTQISLS
jgi:hypothetical protein